MRLRYRDKFLLKRLRKTFDREPICWDTPGFECQNAFLNSKARRVAAQCTRRAGKSYAMGKKILKTAWENSGCNIVYIALTRASAESILYKDILKELLTKYKIKAKENASKLTYTLSNGSVIMLTGADQSVKEMYKLLGKKFKLVCIDEAAFFKQDLGTLIEEIINPTLIDQNGQLYMVSTTGFNTRSYYYKVATGAAKGWEVHKWTAYENPIIAVNWDKFIKSLLDETPGIEKSPGFRRMYKNEWVVDDALQIYKFNPDSIIPELPDTHKSVEWKFGLGIDLGWNDPTAFIVVCWNQFDNNLYIVFKHKKSEMDFSQVAAYCEKLEDYYGAFHFVVVDNAAKQGVETMRNLTGINFIAAEKTAKREYIELFNSEMAAGKIKTVSKDALEQGEYQYGKEFKDPLISEWANLIWNEEKFKKGVYEELASLPNHLCDTALYAWRYAYSYTSIAIPKAALKYDSEEQMLKDLAKELKNRRNQDDDESVYDEMLEDVHVYD